MCKFVAKTLKIPHNGVKIRTENALVNLCVLSRAALPCTALGGKKPNSTEIRSFTMAHIVTDECVACGACEGSCPVGAISMADKAVVDAATCIDCGACEGVCPTGAIKAE